MEQYVVVFKEDIMALNDKTSAQKSELLKLLEKYGTVRTFENAVADIRAEYQGSIDNLNTLYKAIADQNLTASEVKLVKLFRELRALDDMVKDQRIAVLEKNLADVEAKHQDISKQIVAILGEKEE